MHTHKHTTHTHTQYGSGLTHNNLVTGEGNGAEVTDVVKKVLDERLTRQHQLKEQVNTYMYMYMYHRHIHASCISM